MAEAELASTMIVNDSAGECVWCSLGPPPDLILKLPPPPMPGFVLQAAAASAADYYPSGSLQLGPQALPFLDHFNSSPCKHSCEWRAEGVQYVEMPQQGNVLDDTWLLVLISSCIGVIFVGIILATLMIRCKLTRCGDVSQSNDDASECSNRSNKNSSTLSTSSASSGMHTTTTSGGTCSGKSVARLQTEAVLYPCGPPGPHDPLHDSRLMWATLTPRGTTRHYLEEHTYETVGCNGQQLPPPPPAPPSYVSSIAHKRPCTLPHQPPSQPSQPHQHVNLKTYNEPPAPSPILNRPKDEKAFDNTAFVDYEEPLSLKNEYYQLEDVLEPCDPIFSVQGLYGMPVRNGPGVGGTLRPRVSSPTRIEHPNLPPLNLQPSTLRKHSSRKNSLSQHTPECTLLRAGMPSATYIPTI